jgi:hypothetical protein
MLATNKTIASVIGFLIFSASAQATNVSIAQVGKQCSGEIAIPSISCINPDGADEGQELHDVRLYIMEFQGCKDGNITSLTKSISGFVFSEEASETTTSVVFSSQRIHFDERADDLTVELPKSAVIQTVKSKFLLDIDGKQVPLYDGADVTQDYAFNGTFKKVDAQGATLSAGRILCTVSR